MATNQTIPIACTLSGDNFRSRVDEIAELNRSALRTADVTGRTLELRYSPGAAHAVRELVAKERQCCAFLDFDVQESSDEVRLRVTVPERAAEHAEALLRPFMPLL